MHNLSQPKFFPITSFFYTDSGMGDNDPNPLKGTPPIFEKLYRGSPNMELIHWLKLVLSGSADWTDPFSR
jgi:hypothetical protein